MPELPEVETVRKQLTRKVIGQVVRRIEVFDRKIFVGDEASIVGEEISRVGRVGKYLFIHFKSGRGLGIHLKMTGRLVWGRGEYSGDSSTRAIITLASGEKIYYWDSRKFGYIKVVENIKEAEKMVREKLGPEPWEIDEITFLRKLQKT